MIMDYDILVIDDSKSCLAIINTIIARSELSTKLNVTFCYDAFEAKQKVKENKYNLVITDIVMPHLDGYEIIAYIKQRTSTPVVAISSGYGRDDPSLVLNTALAIGADKALYKFRLQKELIKTISKYCSLAA